MKRLTLLAIPLLLTSPARAADLDGPRYGEREIIIERPPQVVVEERYYYRPAPVIEYYEDDPVIYIEGPYRRGYGLRHLRYYGWFRHRHRHH
jgi:hypothetical protein